MQITRLVLAAAGFAAVAAATASTGKAPPPQPLGPAPGAIVGSRQGSMIMAATTLNSVSVALERNAPAKSLAFPISGLVKWSEHLPSQFAPSTSQVPGTRAKPEVWSNRQEFLNRATDMALAADMMLSAAKADDSAALTAALAQAKAGCQSCHDTFQVPGAPAKAG
jgi:cytochrome c556